MNGIEAEYFYLVILLKSVINGTEAPEKPENISFERIFQLAQTQSMANMAYYAVEKLSSKPCDELMKKWIDIRDRAVVKDMMQNFELDRISAALSHNEVRHMPVRDCIYKSLYPQSDMRVISGVNILVRPEDSGRIHNIMLSLGCRPDGNKFGVYYRDPSITAEISQYLFDDKENFSGIFENPLAMCESPDKFKCEFDRNNLLLYLLEDILSRYKSGKCSLVSIVDLQLCLKKYGNISAAKKLCHRFSGNDAILCEALIDLAGELFGDKKFEHLKEAYYVLYGELYPDIIMPVPERKFRALLRNIFPSYGVMKSLYPILEKIPALLPFLWIYGFFGKKPKM